MEHLCKVEDCCGCLSCYNICKSNAITLEEDEMGFVYPLVIKNNCINCGACDNICPILKKTGKKPIKEALGARLKDRRSLSQSTSGGIATYFAKKMLEQDSIIYGVSYIDNVVTYDRVDDIVGISRIRGTKYSEPKKIFWQSLEEDINNKKTILFFGTPCTIAAVKIKFPSYEQLYTCELVCHGITSTRVLKEYIEYIEKKYNKKVKKINVRHKKDGVWDPPYLKVDFIDNTKIEELFFTNSIFGYAFQNISRPSCYKCKFKGEQSLADLTIGDFWGVDKTSKIYTKEGVSIVLVRTKKGEKMIDFDDTIIFEKVDYNKVVKYNYPIVQSTKHTKSNLEFTKKFAKYPLNIACKKSNDYRKMILTNQIKNVNKHVKELIKRIVYEKK